LVANAEISRADTFHASCWFLAIGLAASLSTLALAAPIERWSGAPGLAAFLPGLTIGALLERAAYVPEKLLVRQLRFGWLSLARAIGELLYTAIAVTAAACGAGAAAVVWGPLARAAFRLAALAPAVDVRDWLEPHRLRLPTLLRIVGYGTNVTIASVASFGMRRWDNLLVSRYYGAAV